MTELVDRLLEAQRPRAAFNAVHMDWQKVETSRLKRLLMAVAGSNTEPAGSFQLNTYEISAALEELNQRAGVTRDEMAQLEFVFITALDHSEHGIPNLERQVTATGSPSSTLSRTRSRWPRYRSNARPDVSLGAAVSSAASTRAKSAMRGSV